MSSALFERVRGIAADVLSLPMAKITSKSSPENTETWDSVRHLNLILALEQEFGVGFEPEEYEAMSSLDRILAIIQAKREDAPKRT